MPETPELRYEVTLHFPGEPRVSDFGCSFCDYRDGPCRAFRG